MSVGAPPVRVMVVDDHTLFRRGLIALLSADPARVRPCFVLLRELRDRLRQEAPAGIGMDELSMGMSGDFELAIEEGATVVRVGQAGEFRLGNRWKPFRATQVFRIEPPAFCWDADIRMAPGLHPSAGRLPPMARPRRRWLRSPICRPPCSSTPCRSSPKPSSSAARLRWPWRCAGLAATYRSMN